MSFARKSATSSCAIRQQHKQRGRIVKAVRRLAQFPEAGRAWRLEGCRELIMPGLRYLVIYKVTGDSVIVASLFHEAREVPHVH